MAFAEMLGDGLGGFDDVGHVGVAIFGEGGGDADDEGVALGEPGEIGGGVEALLIEEVADIGGGDVLDVALAGEKFFYLGGIDVESDAAEASAGEGADEGEANVSESEDADDGVAIRKAFEELLDHSIYPIVFGEVGEGAAL